MAGNNMEREFRRDMLVLDLRILLINVMSSLNLIDPGHARDSELNFYFDNDTPLQRIFACGARFLEDEYREYFSCIHDDLDFDIDEEIITKSKRKSINELSGILINFIP